MIPSRRWFPTTLQERAAWYDNFATQFNVLATQLGFTALDQSVVDADNDVMQFLASTALALDGYKEAVRQYRVIITEGNIGDPTPAFPANPAFSLPTSQPTGMFERLDNLVKRIRVSPSYTDEAGALLGIIPAPTPTPVFEDLKPVIKASQSFENYSFDVNVTRLGMSAYKIQIQRQGENKWTDNGFAQGNPFTVTVTPTTAGQPERILVRAILLDKNTPVGMPSDPTYVTVNP